MSVKFARCALWGEGEEAPRKRGCYSNSEFSRHYNSGTLHFGVEKIPPGASFLQNKLQFCKLSG